MKKVLSILLSTVLLVTAVFAFPASAGADAGYYNTAISSNITKLKNYIVKNGFINGNGDYGLQYVTYDETFNYYNLFIVDSEDESLSFRVNIEYADNEDLFGVIYLGIEPPSEKVMYVETAVWVDDAQYSDLGGHAFIDHTYNHNTDYPNFYVDYNDINADTSAARELFAGMLEIGFTNWDYMLTEGLDMNMGAVGFGSYCKSHTYKTFTEKATLSANGKKVKACSICGKVSSTTTIAKPSKLTLSTTSYTYDGKIKKPTVTVKDSKGKTISSTNYTLTYASGRKNVGKYSVKISFTGNYSGKKTLYFTINPKGTSISSLTSASKGFTVKWKKQTTQTSGYQVQYSTNSSFSSATTKTVSGSKTTSKKMTGLKSGKKYYVRVRTYKTVNGTKFYSSWSKTKTVTTK